MHLRLVFLLLMISSNAYATTYYVDTAGNNSNPGTQAQPFLTIQKGIDTATMPGDTICVNNGTYLGTWNKYGNPGTAGNPITLQNCQGGTVTVELGTRGTTWTSIGGNLYDSDNLVPSSVNNLVWRDTTWMGFGQANCADVDTQDEWCINAGELRVYSTTNPSGYTYRIGSGTIEIRNTSYFTIDGINFLYGGIILQIGYSTSNPTGATSNITVKNGEVAYGSTRLIRPIGSNAYPTTYITLDNMTVHTAKDPDGSNGHCIKFDSNEDGYHNTNAVVKNSEIYDCWLNGIQFSDGWQQGEFFNNLIYDISQKQAAAAAAIRCGDTFYCYIHDNELYGGASGRGTGIYLQELANPSYVYSNEIHGFASSGISIFKVIKTPGDLYIYNNLIHSNSTSGISIFDSTATKIYNNTFYNNAGYQLNITDVDALNVTIKNNIVMHTSTDFAMGLLSTNNVTEDHNIVYNSSSEIIAYDGTPYSLAAYKVVSGKGTGSLQTNPLLTSPTTDFTLTESSPARDAGTNVADVTTTDYTGDFRPQGSNFDIGAYEYPVPGYGMKSGAKLTGGAVFKGSA